MAAPADPTTACLSKLDQAASLNAVLRALANSEGWREVLPEHLSDVLYLQGELIAAASAAAGHLP